MRVILGRFIRCLIILLLLNLPLSLLARDFKGFCRIISVKVVKQNKGEKPRDIIATDLETGNIYKLENISQSGVDLDDLLTSFMPFSYSDGGGKLFYELGNFKFKKGYIKLSGGNRVNLRSQVLNDYEAIKKYNAQMLVELVLNKQKRSGGKGIYKNITFGCSYYIVDAPSLSLETKSFNEKMRALVEREESKMNLKSPQMLETFFMSSFKEIKLENHL